MSSSMKKNTPGVPASRMKQGNLFSFFTKLSPKNKKSKSSETKLPPIASRGSMSLSAPHRNPAFVCSSPSSAAKLASNTGWKKIQLNRKLAVLWPDDNKYYPAVVKKESSDRSRFFLLYEDGESEWVDLRKEKFRFIDEDTDLDGDDAESEVVEPVSNRTAGYDRMKKRRQSYDSDDQEFVLDDAPQEDDDDEMENVDENEETDDQWIVSGDEEEVAPSKAKMVAKMKKKPKVTKLRAKSSRASWPKATPKAPKDSTQTRGALTPPSLESFSAFSSSTRTNPCKRVSPPSTARASANATFLADAAEASDGDKVVPYVRDDVNPTGSHVHNHLKFLRQPKDAQGHSPNEPGYSPRTLMVDVQELKQHYNPLDKKAKDLSPGVAQWWNVKSQYFDCVLLFKTGKFYEMFHMDCDIGVQVLGLQYMKGHIAHAGFPEISYGSMADKLVQAGYKVARVEQTETPERLNIRRKATPRGSSAPKVVNREVCSILTMGTRTHCYLDGDSASDFSPEAAENGPLLVIKEVLLGEEGMNQDQADDDALVPVCEYGIVVVHAARAAVTIGQFADDILRSRMMTLLATYFPSEVLVEGGENGASAPLRAVLKLVQTSSSSKFRMEDIHPLESFPMSTAIDASVRCKLDRKNGMVNPWNVQETLDELHRKKYFPRSSRQQQSLGVGRWPKVLRSAIEGNADLALSSLGAALFYLQRNLIDEQILSMGDFHAYSLPASPVAEMESEVTTVAEGCTEDSGHLAVNQRPSLVDTNGIDAPNEEDKVTHMSLDGNTLVQLEILNNSLDNKTNGSLSWLIDHTKTAGGSRLLRAWLLRPLFRKADIDRRGDAVEELLSGDLASVMKEASGLLSKCGDLERMIANTHAMNVSNFEGQDVEGSSSHPITRAVLYETKTYTKRKVGSFSKLMKALRSASKIPELFAGIEIQSGLLRKIVRTTNDGGLFPNISGQLDWFNENIDLEKAAAGEFEPGRGVDAVFDDACDEIDRLHSELEGYKNKMCSTVLKGNAQNQWHYVNTAEDSKDKFTIELPKSIPVTPDFRMIGKRGSGNKQICKYRTPTVEVLVKALERAIDVRKERKARQLQMIFARFDSKRHLWSAVAIATATFDALASLAEIGKLPGYCRPTILECPPNSNPFINIVQGRHPCVEKSSGDFIPNDIVLGSQEQGEQFANVLLLSGPNMGGKSTLLRQTCLICILAQIGSAVPAKSCSLTPIDVMVTRLGASDRILLGQSTFFVELAETAAALRGATRRSLILFDELGRGTSSFDGTAIASACLSYICTQLKCLSLFATHYHTLLEERKNDPSVRLAHMESKVNEEDKENDNITFLYTLNDGACPKSFGINVARLAHLPGEVLAKAKVVSADFEFEMNGDALYTRATPEQLANRKEALVEIIDAGDGNIEEIEKIWEWLQ